MNQTKKCLRFVICFMILVSWVIMLLVLVIGLFVVLESWYLEVQICIVYRYMLMWIQKKGKLSTYFRFPDL